MATVTPPRPTDVIPESLPWSLDSQEVRRPNGAPLAALLSAGIGAAILGIFTTLAQIHAGFKALMDIDKGLGFNVGVGPLSGKTAVAVIAWLLAWAIASYAMHGKDYAARPFVVATFVLVAVGVLGTFPLFFESIPVIQK